jgi:RecA/RadA recombinase
MASKKKGAETSAPKVKRKSSSDDDAPSRNELAQSLMEEFNKKMHGRAEICPASELSMPYITKRLPTGLLTLDLELRGGFPSSGVSQLVGPKNAGKSYVYWQVIRQLQSILGNKMMTLLAMNEMRADKTQGRLAGVRVALADEDIERMNAGRQANGWPPYTNQEMMEMRHQVGEIHETHAESAELLFDIILAAVEQNIYHLIVLDSIGGIESEQESEQESMTEKVYGGAAKPITQFMRKLSSLLTIRDQYGRTRDTCIIVINQVRDDIGDKTGKGYRTTGGHALEHAKFVDLYISSGKQLGGYVPVYGPGGTTQKFMSVGKEVNWKIEKGKAGIHEGARGAFNYLFSNNSADFYRDALVAGVQNGVIEASGAWLGIPDPENPKEFLMRAQGADKFCQALADDVIESAQKKEESLMDFIRDQCFKKQKIDMDYKNWK